MFWQGLLKHRMHQQSPSWWYSIAKTSLVHKNKRRPFQSTLAWNFTAAALYILQHRTFEKREEKKKKKRHLKTGTRNIGSSQSFHIGAVCWSWRWAFFSSLSPSELHTSTSSYRYWQSCYHVVVVLPLTTSATPDGYQSTFVICVNSEAPISVSSLLQWWICCAQAHGQAHEQCNAMVKGNGGAVGLASNPGFLRRWVTAGPQFARSLKRFELTMTSKSADCLDHHEQSYAPQKAFSWDKRSSSCFFWGSWKSIWRRWRMPLRPGLQSHCRRGCLDCS